MSADNFMTIDHDGECFVVKHGFMSATDDPDYEPTVVARVKTENEVYDIIDDYAIIEYGVDWTAAARAACGETNAMLEEVVVALNEAWVLLHSLVQTGKLDHDPDTRDFVRETVDRLAKVTGVREQKQ